MKKKIIYAGYIFSITLFFLYYLFPGDAVTSYVNHNISRMMSPDVVVKIKQLKPDFPPGVKLLSPEVSYQNQLMGGADTMTVTPAYGSLFKETKAFFIHGDLYGGVLDAEVRAAGFRPDADVDLEAVFEGIQISGIPAVQMFPSYRISGNAGGEIKMSRNGSSGQGTADLLLKEPAVMFTPALFGLEQLNFSAVRAEAELRGPRMVLKKITIDGRDITGTATGNILLRSPLTASTLDIRGEIKPHPGFMKKLGSVFPVDLFSRNQTKTGGLPFRITGSLERPNFALR